MLWIHGFRTTCTTFRRNQTVFSNTRTLSVVVRTLCQRNQTLWQQQQRQAVEEAGTDKLENDQLKGKFAVDQRKLTKQQLEFIDKWTPVYRFNHVTLARIIQRLKIMQTGFTCLIFLPYSIWSWVIVESMESSVPLIVGLSVSTLACIMLYIMGSLSSKLVGAVYISKTNRNRILVSKLSFTGARQDVTLPADSFVHISDLPNNPKNLFIKLEYVDEDLRHEYSRLPKHLYLSLKYGSVYDFDGFVVVFGEPTKVHL